MILYKCSVEYIFNQKIIRPAIKCQVIFLKNLKFFNLFNFVAQNNLNKIRLKKFIYFAFAKYLEYMVSYS